MQNVIKAPAAAPRKPVLAIGESIEKLVERTSITLQRPTADVWTVTVYEGTRRVEDQCGSYSSEVAAALVASAYFQLAIAETIEPAADPAAPLAQGEIRTHRSGAVVITIQQTPQAGYLIQGRIGGDIARDLCSRHDFDIHALARFAELVAAHPVVTA